MQIFFHFGDGETTVSEAPETLDPFDIVVIEDTIIAAVPLHVGYQSLLCSKILSSHRSCRSGHRLLS